MTIVPLREHRHTRPRDILDHVSYQGEGETYEEVATELNRLRDLRDELVLELTAAVPALCLLATEEARANKAPTGLPPRHVRRDRYDAARSLIERVRS